MISKVNREFTILLVDDREENLISLEEILDEQNRKFIKATSGNEALKIALKNPEIGLVMLDVQMPEMDGFEVAELLKSNPKTKDLSIIFVTAINKEDRYVLKGFETGAVDYLQKPLDIDVVRAKVNVFEKLYFYQKALKEALAEKDKVNQQLERFMYVVAHDLKSPLSGVISLLSLVREEEAVQTAPGVSEYLNMAMDASYHLSNMITSILEYSRQVDSAQTSEDVDTHEMVSQIIQLMYPPKHLHLYIKDTLPRFKTRKLKLQQVFQNLVSNAIKYNDKPDGKIQIGVEDKADGFYTFYVKDNGPGIQKRDHERIFNLFETTDNASGRDSSTGVGLNLLKVLVEEQGGKIWVDSMPGEGSCFFFQWCK
ncbi:MAG: hybrid sensor histidine kinase/response regulator [Sphingobacteriales bacterium]|nr:MAG: hybrid sensor histidine kinase/response regulator [Sphingobacteriales bacterium]